MHIYRRERRYYFRYVLPESLAKRFQTTEIRFSLFTYNKKYASRLSSQHYLRCLELIGKPISSFQEACNYVKTIVPTNKGRTLVELIGSVDATDLQNALRLLSTHNIPFYATIDPSKTSYADGECNVSILLPDRPTDISLPYFEGGKIIVGLVKTNEISLFSSLRQIIYLHEIKVQYISEEILGSLRRSSTTKPSNSKPARRVDSSPLLSVELTAYLELNDQKKELKTREEYESIVSLFIEVVGEKEVREITNEDYDSF